MIIGFVLQDSSWCKEKLWLIGPLALQLQLGCVALCSCKRHVARACPAAPPLQQTLNLWIPAAPSLQQQQQQTSFLASCSQQHCTPATHLKYRIDRQQQQQQSRPWVLRSNGRREGGPGARRSWRKCVNQSTAQRGHLCFLNCLLQLCCCCTTSCCSILNFNSISLLLHSPSCRRLLSS